MSENQPGISRTITILGPTACGKTRRAVELARLLDAEIVSCDSRQVYRDMDLGTGKDRGEYGDVPVHLLDVCRAGERYNLFRFLSDARTALDGIARRGRRAILCGGSGMYLENLIAGISLPDVPCNPELRSSLAHKSLDELTEILRGYKTLHNTTDVDTAQRAVRAIEIETWYQAHPELAASTDRNTAVPLDTVIIGLDIPRDLRRSKIDMRLQQRLDEGMIDEVRNLISMGVDHDTLMYYGLEYKFISLHLQGLITLDEMQQQLRTAIHQFAKRQMTWFRGMERRGFTIHWLPFDMPDREFGDEVMKLL